MTNWPYTRDIPFQDDDPADDQPDMLINTNSIDSLIAEDHFSFGVNNGGFHKQFHTFNQPAPALSGADGVLYANLINGDSWPIWRNALGSTVMMSSFTNNTANGFASLPGGMLIQWGIQPGSSANTIPVAFPTQFTLASIPTNAFTVQVIPERAATSPGNDFSTVIVTGSITSLGFTIGNIGSHTMVNWYWIAIGPKN